MKFTFKSYGCPKCEEGTVYVLTKGEGNNLVENIEPCNECGHKVHSADRPLLRQHQMIEDIETLEAERLEWSLSTFPEATSYSSLQKLKTEILEIEMDITAGIKRPEEYADALMCLFDSAGRQGILPENIFRAFAKKLKVNKARKWIKNPDNTYSHVK